MTDILFPTANGDTAIPRDNIACYNDGAPGETIITLRQPTSAVVRVHQPLDLVMRRIHMVDPLYHQSAGQLMTADPELQSMADRLDEQGNTAAANETRTLLELIQSTRDRIVLHQRSLVGAWRKASA